MKKCPKCGCERFYATAHVVEEWIVDANGRQVEVTGPALEVLRLPDNEDTWICTECGYDDEGSAFEVKE